MKIFTDDQLIAMGLQIQEARSKGGKTILKTYGKKHFSMLGKLSADKKRKAKSEAISLS